MPPNRRDALILPDNDLAMHAGEQIFGVSRHSEEDPDQSRNDLDSMHTFSAVSPDHENIHPDWIGRFSAAMCSKHLGGMEGDGARALRPSFSGLLILGVLEPWRVCHLSASVIIARYLGGWGPLGQSLTHI